MDNFKAELISDLLDLGMPVNPTKEYKDDKPKPKYKCKECSDRGFIIYEKDGSTYAEECPFCYNKSTLISEQRSWI